MFDDAVRAEQLTLHEAEKLGDLRENHRHHVKLARDGAEKRWHAERITRGDTFDALLTRSAERQILTMEQLTYRGHNVHPLGKLRVGWSDSDVRAYAPEYVKSVPLRLYAVQRSTVHSANADAFSETLRREYSLDAPAPDRLLLPVHPWQAEKIVPDVCAEHLRDGRLTPLPHALAWSPGLSVRTGFTPSGYSLKTALSVQLTSTVRTISPSSALNGPVLSDLLSRVLREDSVLSGRARWVREIAGSSLVGDPATLGRVATVVLREKYAPYVPSGGIAVTAASLGASALGTSHFEESTLLRDALVRCARVHNLSLRQAAQRFFTAYTELLVPVAVTLMTRYGVGVDAHLQNTVVVLGTDGVPQRLLLRDTPGMRVHIERMEQAGLTFAPHAGSVIMVQSAAELHQKFTHAVVLMNCAGVVQWLHAASGVDARSLWSVARRILTETFQQLSRERSHVDEDAAALFAPTLERKAFLRMLLKEGASYPHIRVPNPLHREEVKRRETR